MASAASSPKSRPSHPPTSTASSPSSHPFRRVTESPASSTGRRRRRRPRSTTSSDSSSPPISTRQSLTRCVCVHLVSFYALLSHIICSLNYSRWWLLIRRFGFSSTLLPVVDWLASMERGGVNSIPPLLKDSIFIYYTTFSSSLGWWMVMGWDSDGGSDFNRCPSLSFL